MLNFENVMYRYRDDQPPAINDLTLTIEAGEAVAVMGANGSGKSTLARLAAGLIRPVRGRVVRDRDTKVGSLFQNPDNQIIAVTVDKEIAFALENEAVRFDEMERRVTDTLQRFSITHLRNRITSELSGGEKQKVALAGVMISEPSVLVMDEPDSFLDQAGKATLKEELSALRRQNPQMIQIHITQYQSVAGQYDRLLVFDRGYLVRDESPETVFADRTFCVENALVFNGQRRSTFSLSGDLLRGGGNDKDLIHRISLAGVGFGYGGETEPVIDALSCDLNAGEVVGVTGRSGAGKSTLALLLCGLLEPSAGNIAYYSRVGDRINRDQVLGRVSAVLQQPERQFFLSSCREEISFGPRNLDRPLDAEGIAGFLRMVGLEPGRFIERDPFHLSGGEKRRLAFAGVLAMAPQFVVFDEPTCGLDQDGVGRFIELVRILQRQDRGVVIITHDGDILKSLSTKIIVLHPGQPARVVAAARFFEDPVLSATVTPLSSVKS